MVQGITDNLEEGLNKFIGRSAIIIQNGFIESEYSIEKLKYCIEYEILTIADEEDTNYIQININQIYKIEKSEKEIKFCLDNDLNITIKIKR